MSEENNENKNKFGKKETSEDIAENLKEIEEVEKELEERKKKKEQALQTARAQRGEEKKEYSFKQDSAQLFKRKKLKHFISGGKGEKQMLKALGGKIRGIKSKQIKEFASGLKKFADESVKVSSKPTTLKKITMLNYLKQLKKEKHSFLKRSQIRKIRETVCSGQRSILAGREVDKKAGSQNNQDKTEKKFSVSRRTDKSFEGRGKVRKY